MTFSSNSLRSFELQPITSSFIIYQKTEIFHLKRRLNGQMTFLQSMVIFQNIPLHRTQLAKPHPYPLPLGTCCVCSRFSDLSVIMSFAAQITGFPRRFISLGLLSGHLPLRNTSSCPLCTYCYLSPCRYPLLVYRSRTFIRLYIYYYYYYYVYVQLYIYLFTCIVLLYIHVNLLIMFL